MYPAPSKYSFGILRYGIWNITRIIIQKVQIRIEQKEGAGCIPEHFDRHRQTRKKM
jgi:hypothetical protein